MKTIYVLLLLFCPVFAVAQVVTGTVRNSRNEPLDGITVSVKNTKLYTITDEHGDFRITVPDPASVLKFSGVSVEPLEVALARRTVVNVILVPRNSQLDEVHVIAYGTNTQRYSLGSITKVAAADIEKQNVTNPLAALQGRVPGLTVTSSSGLPGASIAVQVRGQNSLNPSLGSSTPYRDNPLFIIDGVPFAPQNTNLNQFTSVISPGFADTYNNAGGGLSPFNSLNPADIESIEILRDADATAIYGSRGGNGVILITTKRGKAGKTGFDLNLNTGITMIGHTMPMMNTDQYLAMRREAFANDGIKPNSTPGDPGYAPDLTVYDPNRYTDWKKYFLGNTAHTTVLNTAISGGNTNMQFRLGAGYNRSTYIYPGDFADNRGNVSVSLRNATADKKLTLDFTSSFTYDKNNAPGSPNLLSAYTLEPNYPALSDAGGNLVWNYKGVALDGAVTGVNPAAYLLRKYNLQSSSLNSSLLLTYNIWKGLSFKSNLGYNQFENQEYTGNPKAAQNPAGNANATASFGTNNYATWIIEPQLTYKAKVSRLTVDLLAGGTLQKNINNRTQMSGSGYLNDQLLGAVAGASVRTAADNNFQYRYMAGFGRINLKWDNKYLLDLNARRDGSSRFGPDKQFGNFGSVGAGWIFSEESWVKSMAWLSYGKLRVSYGVAGNDAIADYQFLSRWAPTTYNYNGSVGYIPQNLYNPNFSWASTKKFEAAAELGFWRDRLLLTLSYYRNRSGNQLITYQLPSQTGFSTVLENWDAVVQNTGLEFSAQTTLLRKKELNWTLDFNVTIPRNKLVSFPGLAQSSYYATYVIGQPLSVLNKLQFAGVNTNTGIFQFYNAAGSLTDTPQLPTGGKLNDYTNIGNLDPKYYGGLQTSLSFHHVQLDVALDYRKQTGVNYLGQTYGFLPGWEFNQPQASADVWRAPGEQAALQQLSSQYAAAATASAYFLQSSGIYSDASFLKLRSAVLSYTFDNAFVHKLSARSLRCYLTGQNLLTITRYKGNDPETQSFYGVPPLRSFAFGMQFNF